MLKRYLLSLPCFALLMLSSCTTQNKNVINEQYRDKNYYDGTQSDLKRNVDQLEKRVEKDENRREVTEFPTKRPN